MSTVHRVIRGTAWLALLFANFMFGSASHANDITAQDFVDLQQGDTAHLGFRRAHAKGVCVSGEFTPSGELRSFTTAKVLNDGQWPFEGRLSIAGNNPTAPDLKAPVRSIALSFVASANDQWRIAMNTPPVMAVADPYSFYRQIQAIQAGPAAVQQFFEEHPESRDFLAWKQNYQPTTSFADETYHSINAFYLVNADGEKQAVRWRLQPSSQSEIDIEVTGENALQQELAQRLAHDEVSFNWLFTLAEPEDDENNPTVKWPDSRLTVNAGRLVIKSWQPQLEGHCHNINFDPLVLPRGIAATADPILNARSAAYAESYRRRAREQLQGDLDQHLKGKQQ